MKTRALNIFRLCKLSRNYLEGKSEFEFNATDAKCMTIDDQEQFEDALDRFMQLKVAEGLSQEFVLITIRRVLISRKNDNDIDYNLRIEEFVRIINSLEMKKHKVIKVVHGVNLSDSTDPMEFENLTIYDLPRHKEQVSSLFDSEFEVKHKYNQDYDLVAIECLIDAKDHWKALELSNSMFNKFELLLAFLLNEKYMDYSVGVLRVNFKPYQDAVINFDGGVISGDEKNNGFISSLDVSTLNSLLPREYTDFYDSLVRIALTPTTSFDRKMASAIEWLGESYMDTNKASAYLKAVIALEALLKLDEKGVITASVMSSIAEQCAFLHGNTVDERINVEKKVKELYSERSKIAHTGTNSVSPKKLRVVREFVALTILRLIAVTVKLALKKPDDFQLLLRKKKYEGDCFH
ncbi:HEPN domain-containing protein [Salinicola lusitanus]|uniref:HEPN domain-containing protein n=1 Tax=Salinicola lusitanus TaxID=1949085 RepID=UPI001300A3FC|nr:HEPN domain-containing protein [Salinicola lusitanus]